MSFVWYRTRDTAAVRPDPVVLRFLGVALAFRGQLLTFTP